MNNYRVHETVAARILDTLVTSNLLVPVLTGSPECPVLLRLSSAALEQVSSILAAAYRPIGKVPSFEKTISSFG